MLKTVTLDYFGISDLGLVRKQNEDVWSAVPEKGLFILADGMGGHKAGEVAAQLAVASVLETFSTWQGGEGEKLLSLAIDEANTVVYCKGQEETYQGMGTTLCVLVLGEEEGHLAHVGDSRIYCLREGMLVRLTEDHTLYGELSHLSPDEEMETLPYKHVLTKSIGTNAHVDPSLITIPLHSSDLFLICSDGLTNFASDEEIQSLLCKKISLNQQGSQLIELAKSHGGGDNITIILVRVTLHDISG